MPGGTSPFSRYRPWDLDAEDMVVDIKGAVKKYGNNSENTIVVLDNLCMNVPRGVT